MRRFKKARDAEAFKKQVPDAHNHTLVAVIIHVEHHHCCASWGRASDDTQTGGIPDKVVPPPLAARIEEGNDCLRFWIVIFDAIAAPFIAVTTG
jgi:hypothetical protein